VAAPSETTEMPPAVSGFQGLFISEAQSTNFKPNAHSVTPATTLPVSLWTASCIGCLATSM
jgi:hypothetical protein